MPLIDFVISNPGHHAAMMLPVMTELKKESGYQLRLLSLCEFRGFATPADRFDMADAVYRLPDRQIRKSSSAGKQSGLTGRPLIRRLLREVGWQVSLKRPLNTILTTKPDLIVLPNDAAFPYDRLVQLLHKRHIPFLLMQEGVRFPLPGVAEDVSYGRGGAKAIAAWGENSAAYFRGQGVPADRIFLTGSPRFDNVTREKWQPIGEQLRQQYGWGHNILLLLTNPIDDQGFCTTSEKYDLIGRFLLNIAPLFADNDLHLVIKLHGRESLAEYQKLVNKTPYHAAVTVLQDVPLYGLFAVGKAAVILASTVGLEALLFNLPLAVLEIPDYGYIHDYVSHGAAVGLGRQTDMALLLRQMIAPGNAICNDRARQYIAQNLFAHTESTRQAKQLCLQLTTTFKNEF